MTVKIKIEKDSKAGETVKTLMAEKDAFRKAAKTGKAIENVKSAADPIQCQPQ